MLVFLKHTGKLDNRLKPVFTFFVLLWLFYLVNEFLKGARLGVVAYFPYMLLGFVPFVNKSFAKKTFNLFTSVYSILIGLSIISWISAMAGLISPTGQLGDDIESLAAERRTYAVYPFCLVPTSNLSDYIRFISFYDEPGVVGTLAGLICCAFRFNIKDWRVIILFLSGLLSASMFFYGLAAVYWLSELLFIKKRYGAVVLLVVGISCFYVATKNNGAVSTLVWDRFEWDSQKGGFVGNTREGEQTEIAMKKIKSSGEIWFGVKDKAAYWDENLGLSSIYTTFAMYGIIFVSLYIIWLLQVGYYYKYNKWDFILYCFVVIGCIYQRSSLFSLTYTFLFAGIARYYEFELTNQAEEKIHPPRQFRYLKSIDNV